MSKIGKYELAYQDLLYLNGYYAKINNDLIPAIYQIYEPTGLEIALFMDIVTACDSARQPCAYSYKDLADKYLKTSRGIKKALKQLIKQNLIKVVGERQGRAKTLYIPNVEHTTRLMLEYLKDRSM